MNGPTSTGSSMVLGQQLLSLLDESAVVATYKPALLMAIIDCVTESGGAENLRVEPLAERVIELYWPQTIEYPTTGEVLSQNQGAQAKVIAAIVRFRLRGGIGARALPERVKVGKDWERLVRKVSHSLAEMPIPRLQNPFENFIYEFDWPWAGNGRWTVGAYEQAYEGIVFKSGVPGSLIELGPLLRPFILRWWSEKAAALNPQVEQAASMLKFEEFMFGRERVALERIAEGLLDLQSGRCFFCGGPIGRNREIDHFVPWSQSGDDGLTNLVASCRRCNNSKRATLAVPDHVETLLERNSRWALDLSSLADERSWPCDPARSMRIARSAYLGSPDERPLWIGRNADPQTEPLSLSRSRLESQFIES